MVVYVALVASIAFAHLLIYWLIKAGIEDSKKPAPLSARQRRSARAPSTTATAVQPTDLSAYIELCCSFADVSLRPGPRCSKTQS